MTSDKNINFRVLEADYPVLCKDLTIEKDDFVALVDYCFANSDYISFSDPWRNYYPETWRTRKTNDKFFSRISDSKVSTFETRKWPSGMTVQEDEDFAGYNIIHVYKCTSALKNLLLGYTDNIFFEIYDNETGRYIVDPNMPDDMCFIRDNKLLLSTVSIASCCHAYPGIADELKFFTNLVGGYGYFLEDNNCEWNNILIDFSGSRL